MPRQVQHGAPDSELISELRQARRIVVLCGAGVSAESGIPTFRDAQTGIWAKHDPMTLASAEGFASDPERVWQWYEWRRSLIADAMPNPGHKALAELQARRPSTVLITQNVDGLQQRAGADRVLELHGNLQRNICSQTRKLIDPSWVESHDQQPPPSPHHADGLTRPDVVWFGEALDDSVLAQAFDAAEACDLMLVVGTSGLVHPAAGLPRIALAHGACLIEINPQSTPLTPRATWHWPEASSTALPSLLGLL